MFALIFFSYLSYNNYADYFSSSDYSRLTFESEIFFKLKIGSIGYFSNKFPSSKCVKVVILILCLLDYVEYGIYETDGRVESESVYGCGVYDNALNFFYQEQRHVIKLSLA